MSDSQNNGSARHELPRYADGRRIPPEELDMIARAFGFHNANHMDTICAAADRRRAARKNFGALAS